MQIRISARVLIFAALAAVAPAQMPTGRGAVPSSPSPLLPNAGIRPATPTGQMTDGATRVLSLLESLVEFDSSGRPAGRQIGFEIPERALNEYIAYALRNRPRPGIAHLTVKLLPRNEIAVSADLDFARLQSWNPDAIPEELRPALGARSAVSMLISFETRNGTGTIRVKEAELPEGIAIPAAVMETLLRSLAAHQPEAYDANKPIPLPFGLKRVWTEARLLGGTT